MSIQRAFTLAAAFTVAMLLSVASVAAAAPGPGTPTVQSTKPRGKPLAPGSEAHPHVVALGSGAVVDLAGCQANTLPGNDDLSTDLIPLPFTLNVFGTSYSSLYVNNNGNVTFTQSLPDYTPFSLQSTTLPIIAPFFGDVDTRTGAVTTYGATTYQGHNAFCVDWVNVGYFDQHTDKLNSFQLLLQDRSDTGAGNFDIFFNYDQIQWETGDASSGVGGLGGFSARVGYSNGHDAALELNGSAVNGAFLDSNPVSGLVHHSFGSTVPGRYIFSARSGSVPLPSLVSLMAQPIRVVDTRNAGGPIQTGQSQCFKVAGVNGIPFDASGIVLNATAVSYTTPGWLTVYPMGQAVPATSTLNFEPNAYAIANGVIARVGNNGQVCVSVGTVGNAAGSSNVVLDVTGFLTSSNAVLLPLLNHPQRLVDTRTSGGPLPNGTSRCFTVAGQMGIPNDATGVLLNVTGVGYSSAGWLTLYPAGQTVPATSTLNVDPNAYAIANGAIARIGTGGQLCVSFGTINNVSATSNVILDATGYVTTSGIGQMPLLTQPQRLVDTRTSGGPIAAGQSRCFTLAGVQGLPADALGLVVNVAAVGYQTPGWVTLYPNGQSVPATSTLNFDQFEYAMANGSIMTLGTGGQLCVNVGAVGNAQGSANVIIDVTGYLTGVAPLVVRH